MLGRLLTRSPTRTLLAYHPSLRRSAASEASSQRSWLGRAKSYIEREAASLQTTMVTRSNISFISPFSANAVTRTTSLSDIAGHGSFLLLAFSYLETDLLHLRMFAVSGVTLSIIFQYYREKPLWIPIRWNTLFLLINAVMIVMLLKEENDAYNVPVEKKAMYERFARKGMSPVDFLQLISAAKRVEVKKGDVIVDEGRKNTRVYFIKSGRLSVIKNGAKIREIQTNQFTGEMSFIRWEERIDTDTYLSKAKKSTNKMWEKWETKDTETELFLPLLVVCESLIERWGLREQMASRPEQATTSVHSVQGNHAGAGVKGDISEEAGYAGITVDANGNVLASDTDDSSSGRQTAQEQTLFGRYLNASYNFLGGLLSSHTEQTNAEEGVAQPGSANEGEFAAATVVAEEDCVLYFWSFKRLHALIEQHPSLGRSFERVLSEDLNKKMVTTMALEPSHRYQLLLAAATMDGEPSEASRASLAAFRQQYRLTTEDHLAALSKLGWTATDFEAGYKGAPPVSVQQQYQKMLEKALEGTDTSALSDEKRTDLRVFRLRNGINSSAHLAALKKIGWTIDEFEVGSKNPELATQKEYNAIVVNERTQRRNRIRNAVVSYLFPQSSNEEQATDLVVKVVGDGTQPSEQRQQPSPTV